MTVRMLDLVRSTSGGSGHESNVQTRERGIPTKILLRALDPNGAPAGQFVQNFSVDRFGHCVAGGRQQGFATGHSPWHNGVQRYIPPAS